MLISKNLEMIKTNINKKVVVLFTPYFNTADEGRQQELDECMHRNISNAHIDKIILIIDDGTNPLFESDKIQIIRTSCRPTYSDWIQLTLDLDFEGISILANSDIFFDESITLMSSAFNEDNVFMALSRWEFSSNHSHIHKNPHWSQDVWAVSVKNKELRNLIERTRFSIGVPRCDNKIAYVFSTAGWSVRNPCNIIRTYHLHDSDRRGYDKKLDASILGTVTYVEPSKSLEDDSVLHFDTWTLKEHRVQAVKINNSLAKWRQENSNNSIIQNEQFFEKLPHSKVSGNLKSIIYKTGDKIFLNSFGTRVYAKDGFVMVAPSFDPKGWLVLSHNNELSPQLGKQLYSQTVTKILSFIADKPKNVDDINFWQYPCKTEWQAMENHRNIGFTDIDPDKKLIKLYIPLPWATYIDKNKYPEEIFKIVKENLSIFKVLSQKLNYKLEVHTVCQHIHWHRLIDVFDEIGITDLSLSHCSLKARVVVSDNKSALRLHPWSLYAVNYSDSSRGSMLVRGKPISERKYLASFIGAHMPHYLSDIRVKLFTDFINANPKNVLVDLGSMWHFNRVVYDSQVKGQIDDIQALSELSGDVSRYNHYLSNSIFSLCPEGAGPNTLRLWESIAVGAIPVLFNRNLEFPHTVATELSENCIFWETDDFGIRFYDWLKTFTTEDLHKRSVRLMNLYCKIENVTCF